MEITGWVIIAVLNVPVYYYLGKWIFGDWDEFGECVRFWFTPDSWSFFNGEFIEDFWGEMKLSAWAGLCGLAVYGEGIAIEKMFFA